MNATADRRVAPAPGLADRFVAPLHLGRGRAWQVVLLGAWLIVLADFLTGTEVWLGPMYLVIIGLAAWSLGWRQAVVIGIGCAGYTFAVNGFRLYPFGGSADLWNFAVRIFAVLIIVGLLHTVRQMYVREWRLSRTDPLTGALNRAAFFELTSARREENGWSLLVCGDLDGFKTLNDTHGHAAGDRFLASFVQQVGTVIRNDDVLARMGGDEFAIYLDVRDQTAAKAVAVRLHAAMNTVQAADGIEVKCSVGALIIQPGPRDVERELRAADMLMYEAKGIGSSLVTGTAIELTSTWTIQHHWELTPETESVASRVSLSNNSRSPLEMQRGTVREMQQVA